ncbi:unnamed protein product [Paramecium pentaurelia]|uniref:GAF domain-containing protein n=1 Tax=Paramecium pentaurelia TaxID=43138 RepID=A0A8S1UY33_9CILI|nr:unnamed protein product [Paramecium pentaurelia]
MSKKRLDRLDAGQCSTDRSHHKNNNSTDLNFTLHQRLNSNVDEQLQSKITLFSKFKQKELPQVNDSLQGMAQTLSKVSFNEIQHHQLQRDYEKIKTELAQFRAQQIKLYSTITKLQKDNQTLIEKLKFYDEEKLNLQRKIQIEQKQNEELTKKLKRSEQRIQIILESNIIFQKDQIKTTLLDTLHENEHYKMEAIQKQKDLQKLQINNNNLNHKLNRLTNRIVAAQRHQTESEFIDQDKMVITFTEIPTNFIFRHIFQNIECKQFISTSLEQTPEQFGSHFNLIPQDQKKIHLIWLFNHMVNYREFSQQHNNFIIKLTDLIVIKTYSDLYAFIQNMSQFLKVQRLTLWLRDYWTGFFETIQEGQSQKIICSKGAFKDCLEQREAVNKLTAQRHLLYQDSKGDDIYQENTYLYPLITDTVLPAGLLEVFQPTQNNSYSDIQYFTSLLGTFVKIVVQKIENDIVIQNVAKQKDILISQFLCLMQSNDKLQFTNSVKEMQSKLLQISTCDIIFIENNQMFKYNRQGLQSISCIAGVCGQIAQDKKPAFFSNLTKQVHYNQLIDMYTLAPVYIYPILKDNECKAVIELTLTNKQIDRHRFRDPLTSLNQQSNQARMFCECVQTAYLCKFN